MIKNFNTKLIIKCKKIKNIVYLICIRKKIIILTLWINFYLNKLKVILMNDNLKKYQDILINLTLENKTIYLDEIDKNKFFDLYNLKKFNE